MMQPLAMINKNNIKNTNLMAAYKLAYGGCSHKEHLYILALDKYDDQIEDKKSKSKVFHSNPDELIYNLQSFQAPANWNLYIGTQTYKHRIVSNRAFDEQAENGLSVALMEKQHPGMKGFKSSNSASMLFGLKNLVFDIDWHGDFPEMIEIYQNFIEENIEELFENLPMPNIMHKTPHGIQLWYCIEETSMDLSWLFKEIYNLLKDNIDAALKSYYLTLNGAHCDNAFKPLGVARLFTDESSVFILNKQKYTLNGLKDALGFVYKPKKAKKKIAYLTTGGFNPLARKAFLEDYIENNVGEGYRNDALIIYASTCAACEGATEESVMDEVLELNHRLNAPLSDKEVIHIARHGWQHCYKYKNSTIVDKLDISDQEAEQMHLYSTKESKARYKKRENAAKKAENAAKKDKLKTRVWMAYKANPNITEVAAQCGISRPTCTKYINEHRAELEEMQHKQNCVKERKIVAKAHRFEESQIIGKKMYYNPSKSDQAIVEKYTIMEEEIRLMIPSSIWEQCERTSIGMLEKDSVKLLIDYVMKQTNKFSQEELQICLNSGRRLKWEA